MASLSTIVNEQKEEIYILSFNVGRVGVKDYSTGSVERYPLAEVREPQPTIHEAIIDAVQKAAAAGKPPGAIALQEYRYADTGLMNATENKGLLRMLDKLILPGERPPKEYMPESEESRWCSVRQWGRGVGANNWEKDTVILVDSWKYFIMPYAYMKNYHEPAVLPYTSKDKYMMQMVRATDTAEERLKEYCPKTTYVKLLQTATKFEHRWAGVHLVVRGEDGSPTEKQFLLISYHGRLCTTQKDEGKDRDESYMEKQPKKFIHSRLRTAMSREFLVAVNEYAANRQGIGRKQGAGYRAKLNAPFTGIPALVTGDWNSEMEETFKQITKFCKGGGEAYTSVDVQEMGLDPQLNFKRPSCPVRDVDVDCEKIDYAIAANPETISHDNAHILSIKECCTIDIEEKNKAIYSSNKKLTRFDHDPLIFTCRLAPKSSRGAHSSEIYDEPALSGLWTRGEQPDDQAVHDVLLVLSPAMNALRQLGQPGPEKLLAQMQSFTAQLQNLLDQSRKDSSGVTSYFIAPIPEPPEHNDRGIVISQDQSTLSAVDESQRTLTFNGEDEEEETASTNWPPIVHSAQFLQALVKPGSEYNNKQNLRDLIRHMVLDLLEKPEGTVNVPYSELPSQFWWPAPDVASVYSFRWMSKDRLREVYDELRLEYFVPEST